MAVCPAAKSKWTEWLNFDQLHQVLIAYAYNNNNNKNMSASINIYRYNLILVLDLVFQTKHFVLHFACTFGTVCCSLLNAGLGQYTPASSQFQV